MQFSEIEIRANQAIEAIRNCNSKSEVEAASRRCQALLQELQNSEHAVRAIHIENAIAFYKKISA